MQGGRVEWSVPTDQEGQYPLPGALEQQLEVSARILRGLALLVNLSMNSHSIYYFATPLKCQLPASQGPAVSGVASFHRKRICVTVDNCCPFGLSPDAHDAKAMNSLVHVNHRKVPFEHFNFGKSPNSCAAGARTLRAQLHGPDRPMKEKASTLDSRRSHGQQTCGEEELPAGTFRRSGY